MRPLLRWAGSKRRLLPDLLDNLPQKFNAYYEPFAGSACLYFAIAPTHGVLGDINSHLIDTYKILSTRARSIHQQLSALPSSKRTYSSLREREDHGFGLTSRAIRFLYLNRHAFNGVYRENLAGRFNVPYGSKIPSLPSAEDFVSAGRALRNAELRNSDFEECLSDVGKSDFVYLDPPYSKRGARNRGEYGANAFTNGDVSRFVRCLKRLDSKGAYVLASFYDSRVIRRELSTWEISPIRVERSVSGFREKRRSARELILRNY
jgi:DNA adenine methylase